MPGNIIELDEKSFDKKTGKGNWIVDFWAEWCGPCKIMQPHFESASRELQAKVNFAEVNVDENYGLSDKFNIMAVPTTLFIKDGEVIHASTGALNKGQIIELAKESF